MAEVQPPPVILYPQSHDNNGAGHYSQSVSDVRPIEPPSSRLPAEPLYPSRYDPRFPDRRQSGQTDGRRATAQAENRYPVTPQRRPSPPLPQPAVHADKSGSGVNAAEQPEGNRLFLFKVFDLLSFGRSSSISSP